MEADQDVSRYPTETTTNFRTEAAAYPDDPLADTKWTARYKGERKANEDLERIPL